MRLHTLFLAHVARCRMCDAAVESGLITGPMCDVGTGLYDRHNSLGLELVKVYREAFPRRDPWLPVLSRVN